MNQIWQSFSSTAQMF